jgi:hypothetical protein
MSYTTDKNDPRLGHGVDKEPIQQHEVYLILSEEERAKGFVRPLHRGYVHVGLSKKTFKNPMRPLTDEEKERGKDWGWIAYVEYDEFEKQENNTAIGQYLTIEDIRGKEGCGVLTTMGLALCETYARNPKFYGATYCCGCQKHLPVEEFIWDGTNDRVGS